MPSRLALPLLLITLLCVVALCPNTSRAQTGDMTVGLGGQIGDPSGVTVKFYERPDLPYEFLLALDLNRDYVFLNIHRAWEQPLQQSPVRYFYGPGLVIGVDSGPDGHNQVLTGLSFTLGANFFIERFEVFLNLTPRLLILPATRGDLGGGGGLRYYF